MRDKNKKKLEERGEPLIIVDNKLVRIAKEIDNRQKRRAERMIML